MKKLLLVCFLACLGNTQIFAQNSLNMIRELKEAAEEANRNCPYLVAEGLVLEKVSFVEDDKRIIYEYRYLNYSKSDFDLYLFKTNITDALLQEINTELNNGYAFDSLINNNVIFEYVYMDKQYYNLARVKILMNEPVRVID